MSPNKVLMMVFGFALMFYVLNKDDVEIGDAVALGFGTGLFLVGAL